MTKKKRVPVNNSDHKSELHKPIIPAGDLMNELMLKVHKHFVREHGSYKHVDQANHLVQIDSGEIFIVKYYLNGADSFIKINGQLKKGEVLFLNPKDKEVIEDEK